MSGEDTKDLNLAEMSDEEINNLDPSKFEEGSDELPPMETQGEGESATSTEAEDTGSDETGGAESEAASSGEDTGGADSTSVEDDTDTGTETQTVAADEQTSVDDQSADAGSEEATTTDDSSSDVDFKTEYSKIMAPFKAAKREIKIETPEDARRLMQMGVDYARKMEAMKPYRRVLKTLEKAELIDESEINFLIDLRNKNPEAIKKLLKDSEIDPMDLDLEDSGTYKANDHIVSDKEVVLDDVIDEIRETETFDRTTQIVTKWDDASKELLMGNPEVLRYINQHVETGIYDQIVNKVATERTFGRLNGLSDLEAYKAVGDAMHENGEFGSPTPGASPAAADTNQGGSQPNGSDASVKARKRAASPTKGSASTGKKAAPDFSKMSDKQIEEFDINSL